MAASTHCGSGAYASGVARDEAEAIPNPNPNPNPNPVQIWQGTKQKDYGLSGTQLQSSIAPWQAPYPYPDPHPYPYPYPYP
jgi:hypothetical protein